jgi:hypothetical protein
MIADDMKNNPLANILLGVLAVIAATSVILCALYLKKSHELRTLQGQAGWINARQAALNQLAVDAVEYSKGNPAIYPVLETVGIKLGSPPADAGNKTPNK